VNATPLLQLVPSFGMFDDVIASDGARLAYIVTDTAEKVELHVRDLATNEERGIEISAFTLHPKYIELVGKRVFVIGQNEDGRHVATLIELEANGSKPAGSAVYMLGPANDITVITREDRRRVAVHKASVTGSVVRHQVSLHMLDTGARIGNERTFDLDAESRNDKHDFRVNHWSDGYTRAHGIKGGEWVPKEGVRMPDTEATYDLVTGRISKKPITDLFEQRRRFQALAGYVGPLDFLRMSRDNTTIEWWRGGHMTELQLDEPASNYDASSLHSVLLPDGSGWLALTVDPVNPGAVARRKSDPVFLDVFRLTADGKGERVARVPSKGVRYTFGMALPPPHAKPTGPVTATRFWLLEKNKGGVRGGTSIIVFQLP
jgi:hypothetical protein